MDAEQDSSVGNVPSLSDTNTSSTPTIVPARSRLNFHLALSAIERLRPGALLTALVPPAPAPTVEQAAEPDAASGSPSQISDTPQVDVVNNPTPPLSDSDSDSGSESEAHSNTSSMPSLQTVSESSDDDADMYDSESDGEAGEEWDDEGAPPASDSEWDEREARELVDNLRHGLMAMGSPVQSDALLEDEEGEEWDYEEEDFMDDGLASQGGEATMRSIDLVEWLMSPQRLTADNDPQRAEVLVAGLEAVPDELVRRYEKLRGGEGDAAEGCAICRDDYLIHYECNPAEFWLLSGRDLTAAHFALLPFHPSPHQILVFPCPGRHLFHLSCLAPWLARKTTCPSCRFDIDPHSLTLRRTGTISLFAASMGKWKPPAVPKLEEWLAQEERYKEEGRRPDCAHTSRSEHPREEPSGSSVPSEVDEERRDTAASYFRIGAARGLLHVDAVGPAVSSFPHDGYWGHSTQSPRFSSRHVSPSSPWRTREPGEHGRGGDGDPAPPLWFRAPWATFPNFRLDDEDASDEELPAVVE